MVRVLERSGGHFKFCRPSGYVAMDTSRPMPAAVATLSVTGQLIDFPRVPGESLDFQSGDYSLTTPAFNGEVARINLGAYSPSVAPKIFWGRIRMRYVTRGANVSEYLDGVFATDEWIAWPGGSMLAEIGATDGKIWLWRYMDIEVSGGRWWLVLRQGNNRRKTPYKSPALVYGTNTASRFSIDLALTAGVWR